MKIQPIKPLPSIKIVGFPPIKPLPSIKDCFNNNKKHTIMEKERKITAPEGCEIEKVELIDGVAVITFKEKERKLPKSWEEFCEMFPDYKGEYLVVPNRDDKIAQVVENSIYEKRTYRNAELLPDRATAEAVLALCQLIRLRDCYNGEWVPDWGDKGYKFMIEFRRDKAFDGLAQAIATTPLYFKSEDLRDEFLENFRPLVEKLKPLYGIKEGGDE